MRQMPLNSAFHGVLIRMFFTEHGLPHFHAEYAEREALFRMDTLEIYSGELPNRARALVVEWASLHRNELLENWERAKEGIPLKGIEPLV